MPHDETSSGQRERELVSALQQNEPHAFAALHARYLDRVYGYVLRRVPQSEDAEDVTADVFAAAAQSVRTLRGEAGPLAWLLGIARRKIADHVRRAQRRHEVREADLPSEEPSPFEGVPWSEELSEEFLLREEVSRAVREAVAQLPAAQREALLLRHVDGLSIGEISSTMRRTEDSVKALLRRARASLVTRLTPGAPVAPSIEQRGKNHEAGTATVFHSAVERRAPSGTHRE